MVYGLYLTLDQRRWRYGDFSSDNGLTGTIYTNEAKTTAKNLTGYTVTLRLFRHPFGNVDYLNQTATIVSASGGTFQYLPTQGQMPYWHAYYAKVELTKSGVQESTLNNDQILNILPGPSNNV